MSVMHDVGIRLIDKRFADEIASLPNRPMAEAIALGNNPGHVYSSAPEKFAFIKTNGTYALLVGNADENDLETIHEFLTSFHDIKLICHERYHPFFLAHGMILCPRVELFHNCATSEIHLDENSRLEPIDRLDLFRRCFWFEFMASLYGTPETYLKNGFGVAVCNKDLILSEAYTAFTGKELCEIFIVTNPDARGKGLASFTTQAIVNESLRRNLTPYWSCNVDNPPSLRVALKSGFSVHRNYVFVKNGPS